MTAWQDSRLLAREPVTGGWWLVRMAWGGGTPGAGHYLETDISERRLILPLRAGSEREGWVAALLEPALGGVLEPLPAGLPARCRLRGWSPELRSPAVVLGHDGGIGPALAFAEAAPDAVRFAALGGDQGVPGRVQPSRFLTPQLPGEVMGAPAVLEALGVPARVAHTAGRPGCFEGTPEELMRLYLAGLEPAQREALGLVAFGPAGMLGGLRQEMAGRVASVEVVEFPG